MSRITSVFEKQSSILNIFCTAGYPEAGSTMEVLKALEKHGADMVEVGMPYSDPLADGPVIQESNAIALANGMSMEKLFQDLKDLRKEITISVILMGYFNPILQFGFEKFCRQAAATGIDGIIIPDLPDHAFENKYGEIFRKHNLDFIFLVTPETPEDRVRKLDQLSTGFLYAVSSSSITGTDKSWDGVKEYLLRLASYNLKNPVLLGFGVKNNEGFQLASRYARGAIVGSSYVLAIKNATDIGEATRNFISVLVEPVNAG